MAPEHDPLTKQRAVNQDPVDHPNISTPGRIPAADLAADRVYAETCLNIRATDDISFKLMGIVPLLSGTAILTLFLKEQIPPAHGRLVVALSLFAALITLGLFRWELRNIQTCSWQRRRAEALECLAATAIPKQPKPPRGIGKTEAEKWIYSVTVMAWLSVPVLMPSPIFGGLSFWLYAAAALVIAVSTVLSAFESCKAGGR